MLLNNVSFVYWWVNKGFKILNQSKSESNNLSEVLLTLPANNMHMGTFIILSIQIYSIVCPCNWHKMSQV